MISVIDGSKKLVDANIGDTILVSLINGRTEKIVLSSVNRIGIEGFDTYLRNQPLTFYPYSAIIKVTKFNPLE